MVASKGTCPECGSSEVVKERIMGAQTGDLICVRCKYSSSPSRFADKAEQKEKQKSNES